MIQIPWPFYYSLLLRERLTTASFCAPSCCTREVGRVLRRRWGQAWSCGRAWSSVWGPEGVGMEKGRVSSSEQPPGTLPGWAQSLPHPAPGRSQTLGIERVSPLKALSHSCTILVSSLAATITPFIFHEQEFLFWILSWFLTWYKARCYWYQTLNTDQAKYCGEWKRILKKCEEVRGKPSWAFGERV